MAKNPIQHPNTAGVLAAFLIFGPILAKLGLHCYCFGLFCPISRLHFHNFSPFSKKRAAILSFWLRFGQFLACIFTILARLQAPTSVDKKPRIFRYLHHLVFLILFITPVYA